MPKNKKKNPLFVGPLLPGQKRRRVRQRKTRPTQVGIPTSRMVSAVPRAPMRKLQNVHGVCSITDPFCPHARGAQRPDGGPPSIPYQIRVVYSLTADDVNGGAKWFFIPNVAAYYQGCSTSSTSWSLTTAWNTTGLDSFVTDNAREVRITSFGCIIRSAMTATTAKGLVIVSTDPCPVLSSTYPKGSMKANEAQVHTLAAGTEIAWVSKPMGPTAHLFRPISEFTSTMSNFDWTSLSVEVSGGDVTQNIPYLSVEYVMNVEIVVRSGIATTIAQLQKAPPKPSRLVTAAADVSHASRPSFFQAGIDKAGAFLEKHAMDALDSIMSEGLAFLTL